MRKYVCLFSCLSDFHVTTEQRTEVILCTEIVEGSDSDIHSFLYPKSFGIKFLYNILKCSIVGKAFLNSNKLQYKSTS